MIRIDPLKPLYIGRYGKPNEPVVVRIECEDLYQLGIKQNPRVDIVSNVEAIIPQLLRSAGEDILDVEAMREFKKPEQKWIDVVGVLIRRKGWGEQGESLIQTIRNAMKPYGEKGVYGLVTTIDFSQEGIAEAARKARKMFQEGAASQIAKDLLKFGHWGRL